MLLEERIHEIVQEEITKQDEKKIKEIVADCVSALFKELWFKNNIWKSSIKNS